MQTLTEVVEGHLRDSGNWQEVENAVLYVGLTYGGRVRRLIPLDQAVARQLRLESADNERDQ